MKINLGSLAVTSPAFQHGQRLPDQFSANAAGVSPALAWSGVPEGTQSFAIVAHDPDAPLINGFTHWVVYGIPGDVTAIEEGLGDTYTLGNNGMGEPGWAPAAPPPGHGAHFYYFTVYALDAELDLKPGLSADELLAIIDEHVLNQARIVGTYSN
jgi:Raf kinase inhibitor-like YbhB/YbcL family protein